MSLQAHQLAMGMHAHMDKKKEPARLPIYTHIIHTVQCPATSMLFTCAHSLSGVVSFRRKEKGECRRLGEAGQPKRLDQQTNQAFIFFFCLSSNLKHFFLLALQRHG